MKKTEEIVERSTKLVEPILTEHSFELVDLEFVKEAGNWYLRFYIDKEGGITIDDCELVSRAVSDKLDAEDFIEESYVLEVSSPGLGRPLKKPRDFERNIGEEVEVHLYRPLQQSSREPGQLKPADRKKASRSKELLGVLVSYDDKSFTIALEDGEQMTFAHSDVALVRQALDF